tara:strand:- start:23943 stop:24785 length:843 start_codon:yes stop_codon:yes gene_type:complete
MSQLLKKKIEFINTRRSLPGRVGLVPTMGNLHQGHLDLIEQAAKDCDHVLITIFVNPKQFGPNEDFEKYPRTLEEDIQKIESLKDNKKFIIFAPETMDEIYPEGFQTEIKVNEITEKLCGIYRPGHFDGVTTVVYQLFSITMPHMAYFGQKDYQQFKVIEKMSKDLLLPLSLVMVPTRREESGLAMSSRNQYLSSEEKEKALNLPTKLRELAENLVSNKDYVVLKEKISETLNQDPNWQYLEVLDAETFEEVHTGSKTYLLAGAYLLGKTRLIDNVLIGV